MKEEWRAVPGYEGLYEVSNMGRVRSLDRDFIDKAGKRRMFKGKVLKAIIGWGGYYCLVLRKDGKKTTANIHRIVAIAFLDGYFDGAYVNHKDENKLNNNVGNLEWCTASYNSTYGTARKRLEEKAFRFKKPVDKYDINGNYICTYESLSEASRLTGIALSRISCCCSNKKWHRTAGGYKWKYKTD